MKKFFIAVLTAIMLMVTNASVFAYADEAYSKNAEEAKDVLVQLGIFEEKTLGSNITRGEFVKSFFKYIGSNETDGKNFNLYYTDVNSETENSAIIAYLTENGYLNGTGEGLFEPERNITLAQVIRLTELATGYDALLRNDTVSEYLRVANYMGILDGVNTGSVNEAATFGDIAAVMYNALNLDFLDTASLKAGSVTYKKIEGKTVLSHYLNLGIDSGIITANSVTNLEGTYVQEDHICINKSFYGTEAQPQAEMELGKYADAYYDQDTNVLKALHIVERKTKILEINSRLKPTVVSGSIQYKKSESESKTQRAKISSSAAVISNNKYDGTFASLTNSALAFDTGYVKLIDTNNDSTYDAVMIQKFDVYVADAIGSDYISFKYGKTINGSSKILLNKDVNYRISLDGEATVLSELMEFDVLNIALSRDMSFIDIAVYYKRVSGVISEIGSAKGDETTIKIGTETLTVAKSYMELPESEARPVELNMEGFFYCDYNGQVAAIDVNDSNKNKFGYLTGAKYKESDESLKIKLLTTEGDFVVLDVVEKVKFYGSSSTQYSTPTQPEVVTLLDKGNGEFYQFIMYRLNPSGKVTDIFVEVDNTSGQNSDYEFRKDYSAKNIKNYSRIYRSLLAQKYLINSSVPIFFIPADKGNEKLYSVKTLLTLHGGQDYEFENGVNAYNADPFNLIPQLLSTEGSAGADGPDVFQNLCVVEAQISAVNNAGESVGGLEVYNHNKLETLLVASGDEPVSEERLPDTSGNINDWYYGTKISDLKQGDIIQYELDEEGYVYKFRPIFLQNNPGNYRMKVGAESQITDNMIDIPYVAALLIAYGEVVKCSNGALRMKINNAGAEWVFWVSDASVTIYDSAMGSIRTAGVSDIQPGDKVVLRKTYDASAKEVIIIR